MDAVKTRNGNPGITQWSLATMVAQRFKRSCYTGRQIIH